MLVLVKHYRSFGQWHLFSHTEPTYSLFAVFKKKCLCYYQFCFTLSWYLLSHCLPYNTYWLKNFLIHFCDVNHCWTFCLSRQTTEKWFHTNQFRFIVLLYIIHPHPPSTHFPSSVLKCFYKEFLPLTLNVFLPIFCCYKSLSHCHPCFIDMFVAPSWFVAVAVL